MSNERILKSTVFKYAALLLALFFLCCAFWLKRKFGHVTFDQILYHFEFGHESLLSGDSDFLFSYIKACILPPILIAGLIWFSQSQGRFPGYAAKALRLPLRGAFVILIGCLIYFLHSTSAIASIKSRLIATEDYFTPNYIDPRGVTVKEIAPKNLVLIYVESLENSYSDKTIFSHDLLSPLHEIQKKKEGISFGDFAQMPGTGWTIAGMVGTQCGVPIKSMTIYNGNDQGKNLKAFLPGAVCLGDILATHGYKNIYMRGAALKFAGADKFFSGHHYEEIYGKNEWLERGYTKDKMNKWGLYDEDLFREAKEKLNALMQDGGKFNFTLLTLDTHHPHGNLGPACAAKGYSSFEGIVLCSNEQVADFVNFIDEKGWSDEISVVIMGDHLAMKNPVYERLTENPQRRIFNLMIDGHGPVTKNRENITHFDMLPTMLEFIGFDVAGDRLGLGYSGIAPNGILPPETRETDMQASLLNRSETYMQLWKGE